MTRNEEIEKIIEQIDMEADPPTEEPLREYYYIKKCREIVKKKSEEFGRPLYACSVCMGCQMNAEPEISETRINKGFYKTPTAKKAAGVFFF